MQELRIVVTTSDKYLPAILPLAHLLKKYYSPMPQVLVGGFTPPDFDMPANFTFHSIGNAEDYPIGKWSDGVIKLLREIPDEVFFWLLDDMWPVRQANVEGINILHRYMLQFKNVIKVDLCADRLYAWGVDINYGCVAWLDLIKSHPDSPYHMSCMPGLWRREHLLRVLVSNETPWQIETIGTARLSKMKELDVFGTRQLLYKPTLAFRGGDSKNLLMKDPWPVSDVDIARMRELGLLEPWNV